MLPASHLDRLASASEERPPTTSSRQEHPRGGTTSSRNLFRHLSAGLGGEPSGCFLGSAQRHPLPSPFSESLPAPVRSTRRTLRGLLPSPHGRPQPSYCPQLRVPKGFPEQHGWAAALTFSSSQAHRLMGRRGGATPL